MKLRQIEIQRFRSISTLPLSFEDALGRIQPVTVLAGPNGSGKTSVLFAIVQALRGLMGYRTDDVPEPSELDIHRTENGGVLTLIPPHISVRLTMEFPPEELAAIREVFEQTRELQRSGERLSHFVGPTAVVEWKYPPRLMGPEGDRAPYWHVDSVAPREAFHWFKGRLHAIQGSLRGMLHDPGLIDRVGGPILFPQDRSLRTRVTGSRAQKAEPDREWTVWEILKELGQRATSPSIEQAPADAELKRLAQANEQRIKRLFSQICAPKEYVGFAYTPSDPLGSPYFREGRSHYPLPMASSGEQVIIEYITRLTFPNTMNRGLILIDEPEVHLHPGWVRQLYRALPQLGEDNQFILTTHSSELRAMAAADGVLIDLGDLQR